MEKMTIEGGYSLFGNVKIQGSKNAVLPIIASSILCQETIRIKNCPKIADVFQMISLIESLGVEASWEEDALILSGKSINGYVLDTERTKTVRSSVILLGAMLGRMKNANISYPGGCSIGRRPIDLHLKAFRKMNVEIKETEEILICKSSRLIGNEIELAFPSVGATENIILAAVLAQGTTTIINAAREPEIIELCVFLRKMGAIISGEGSGFIRIRGVRKLHGTSHVLSSDRIVAGTYLTAITACRGEATLFCDCGTQLHEVAEFLKAMGAELFIQKDKIFCKMLERPKSIPLIRTRPYPGFPTDMQSLFLVLASVAEGKTLFVENIFENRYGVAMELEKMGAIIDIQGRTAMVEGMPDLYGAEVIASDLRGAAALVVAGLAAKGTTIVTNLSHLYRGYEDIVRDFTMLGANIKIEK